MKMPLPSRSSVTLKFGVFLGSSRVMPMIVMLLVTTAAKTASVNPTPSSSDWLAERVEAVVPAGFPGTETPTGGAAKELVGATYAGAAGILTVAAPSGPGPWELGAWELGALVGADGKLPKSNVSRGFEAVTSGPDGV